jgi:hypothetical protein
METRNPANLAAPKRRGAQPDQPASYSTRTTYLFLSYLCNSHFAACGEIESRHARRARPEHSTDDARANAGRTFRRSPDHPAAPIHITD